MITSQLDPVFDKKRGVNFKLFVVKLFQRWMIMLSTIITALIVGWLYTRYLTPEYQTTASIRISSDDKDNINNSPMLEELGMVNPSKNRENEAHVLQTRLLMKKVVLGLKLYVQYFEAGTIRDVETMRPPFKLDIISPLDSIRVPMVFKVTLRNQKLEFVNTADETKTIFKKGQVSRLPFVGNIIINDINRLGSPKTYVVKFFPPKSMLVMILNALSISTPGKDLDFIDLNIKNPYPEKYELLLNRLIQEYIKSNIEDKNTIADSTIAFIDRRLVFVSKDLENVETSIQNFKQRNKLANLPEQSTLLISTQGQNHQNLVQIETQLNIVDALLNYVLDAKNNKVIPGGDLSMNPVLADLVSRYNTLILEREKTGVTKTAENPLIQSLDKQISDLRSYMVANLKSTKKGLVISKANIEAELFKGQQIVKTVPIKERNYLDLSRQQDIKQQLYIFLLQKREETAISKTSNISNCKIVEIPESFGPVTPGSPTVLLFCAMMGIILPAGFTYVQMMMNKRIQSKADILELTDIPIVGEIGRNARGEQLIAHDLRSAITEQFRAFRTNLSFFLKRDQKVVLFTSSVSGEGKSFVSINLAVMLALTGKKVVVMEMDLRKPTLKVRLNINEVGGFTNYIIYQETQYTDIIRKVNGFENLFLIPSGPIPPNPAEMILNGRTAQLINELKKQFDYVIMDAPPIGLFTDAQLLNEFADLTIFLVRQNVTFKNQLDLANDLYKSKKMKNLTLLVNDIREDSAYTNYGYGYGYSEYYINPKNKNKRKNK